MLRVASADCCITLAKTDFQIGISEKERKSESQSRLHQICSTPESGLKVEMSDWQRVERNRVTAI